MLNGYDKSQEKWRNVIWTYSHDDKQKIIKENLGADEIKSLENLDFDISTHEGFLYEVAKFMLHNNINISLAVKLMECLILIKEEGVSIEDTYIKLEDDNISKLENIVNSHEFFVAVDEVLDKNIPNFELIGASKEKAQLLLDTFYNNCFKEDELPNQQNCSWDSVIADFNNKTLHIEESPIKTLGDILTNTEDI